MRHEEGVAEEHMESADLPFYSYIFRHAKVLDWPNTQKK